jgi:hypothetical protein
MFTSDVCGSQPDRTPCAAARATTPSLRSSVSVVDYAARYASDVTDVIDQAAQEIIVRTELIARLVPKSRQGDGDCSSLDHDAEERARRRC